MGATQHSSLVEPSVRSVNSGTHFKNLIKAEFQRCPVKLLKTHRKNTFDGVLF